MERRTRRIFMLTVYVLTLMTLGGMIVRSFPEDGVKMLAAGVFVLMVAYISFVAGLATPAETRKRLGFDDNGEDER